MRISDGAASSSWRRQPGSHANSDECRSRGSRGIEKSTNGSFANRSHSGDVRRGRPPADGSLRARLWRRRSRKGTLSDREYALSDCITDQHVGRRMRLIEGALDLDEAMSIYDPGYSQMVCRAESTRCRRHGTTTGMERIPALPVLGTKRPPDVRVVPLALRSATRWVRSPSPTAASWWTEDESHDGSVRACQHRRGSHRASAYAGCAGLAQDRHCDDGVSRVRTTG